MAWVLRHKSGKIELPDTLKVGRKLFPKDRRMSQEHAEFTLEGDLLFVRDLNSANGTFLLGRKLTPQQKVAVSHGDLLMLGETKFAVDEDHVKERETAPETETAESGSPERVWAACALLVFIGLTAVLLGPQSMARGQSVGPKLLSVFVALAGVSVVLIALPLSALFLRVRVTLSSTLAFVGLLMIGSFAAESVLSGALDEQFPFSQAVTASKIEYFCHKHYNKPLCVQSLAACPSCMNSVQNYLNKYGEAPLPAPPERVKASH